MDGEVGPDVCEVPARELDYAAYDHCREIAKDLFDLKEKK